MFVGHYAAALAIKAAEPRAPLWTLAAGCQLVDIGWSALVMADIERVRIDPATLEPRVKVIGCELWSDEPGFAEAAAIDAVFADPHVQARAAVETMTRTDGGEIRLTASPLRMSVTPAVSRR